MSRMRRGAVTNLIFFSTVLSHAIVHVAGELFTAPRHTESKVGETTYFNCSTNLKSREIFWHHGDKYIYTGETILDPYRGRFEIDRNASKGSHNLVIRSVQPSDAGEYICVDDDGHGEKRSAELVVLENDPTCQSNMKEDGVIGQNIFNISSDEIQLTCNVNYHGKIPPVMEWRNSEGNRSIIDNISSNIESNNRLIYTMKLKGDINLDKSSYVCQTTRSTQNQYKCKSEPIKVLYFLDRETIERHLFRGEKDSCVRSNYTFPCAIQWYYGNYTCPLSCDETITTYQLGEYLCRLTCNVRGGEYTFEALKVVVVEATTSFPPYIIALIVMAIILMLGLLICLLIYRKQRIQRTDRLRLYRNLKQEEERQQSTTEFKDFKEEIDLDLLYKLKKSGTTEKENVILGVAIFGKELILVHEESGDIGRSKMPLQKTVIEVYDCDNLSENCRSWHLKEVVSAFDMCSCKRNNCIYIIDKKNHYLDFMEKTKFKPREVLKFNKDGELLEKWSTRNDGYGSLSATKEGNVIVTVHDKHRLLEYSSSGKLAHCIKLPGCTRPWHAIKLDDEQYIVSHGTHDHPHRVCLVDSKGDVLKSFGREMGSAEHQLHIPYHLAVTSKGFVLVADMYNNRVLLLDNRLKFKTKIVPKYKQSFQRPRRIYLDDGLLVVVIGEGIPKKRILVEAGGLEDVAEPDPIMLEHPKETIRGKAPSFRVETEKIDTLNKTEDPKKTSLLETNVHVCLKEPEEAENFVDADYSRNKKGEDVPLLEIFAPKKRIRLETTNSVEYAEEDEILKMFDEWLKIKKMTINADMVKVDASKRIEEDCRLLVFDIHPLFQAYGC